MANIIDLNPILHIKGVLERKKALVQSIIKEPIEEITLGDLYNMALDIQRLETRLKLQIKQPRLL